MCGYTVIFALIMIPISFIVCYGFYKFINLKEKDDG